MNPATVAVVIAGAVVGLALFGARLLLVVDKGEPKPPAFRYGPKR